MNNKNTQKSDSLLSCLSYKGAHSSDKLKLRCYNFKGFLSIYSIPYGNPATFFFLILLLLPFFPFPKGSQLVFYPNNSNKPQTNTKIHNQTKNKLGLFQITAELIHPEYFFPPSFLPSLFPQLYKNQTHKTNKTKTNKSQCNKHTHPSIKHFCAQISTEDIYL